MVEAIRISRAAYPYRIGHQEFIRRFRHLKGVQWWQQSMSMSGTYTNTNTSTSTSTSVFAMVPEKARGVAGESTGQDRTGHDRKGKPKEKLISTCFCFCFCFSTSASTCWLFD